MLEGIAEPKSCYEPENNEGCVCEAILGARDHGGPSVCIEQNLLRSLGLGAFEVEKLGLRVRFCVFECRALRS